MKISCHFIFCCALIMLILLSCKEDETTLIISIEPEQGPAGESVIIIGNHFPGNPIVTFNGAFATVTSSSGSQLTVTVPAKATTGPVSIQTDNGIVEGPVFTVVPETVTFMYNGASVTYEIIVSPITSRKWLDRNLGAPNKPSSYDDFSNYGDLFQWGRAADGHQLVIRAASPFETSGSNTTSTLSANDVTGHASFITSPNIPYDWRSPQNDNLWNSGVNNPCPTGWHIPSKVEWEAEQLSNTLAQAFAQLNITAGGYRFSYDGLFQTLTRGYYWSSTPGFVDGYEDYFGAYARYFNYGSTTIEPDRRSFAMSCRCIKD